MIEAKTAKQRRKASQPAEIVKPRPGPELMMSVNLLQRLAPLLAFQGLSELSVRLRQLTGRDVIDLNRVMEVAHFVYKQQQLARRGADYEGDDFGFDPQWTESFLSVFTVLYRDYWRVETTGIENVPATGLSLIHICRCRRIER